MHWTDDEIKALYQLAAVQPRDWYRIAEALRVRYPDRRQYTIGSIQQKYNEAVRCPAWDDNECAALLKYGKQFPGQWDRITALMKMTFGQKRRSYIGEILERKWKRLKRDDPNAGDSDADSEGVDPNQADDANGATDGVYPNPSPPFSVVAVPIWPVNNPVPSEVATSNMKQQQPMSTPIPASDATDAPAAALISVPIKTDHDVSPSAEPQPVLTEAVKPSKNPGDDQYDEDYDCFRFNPEEAAEILADFGCQFVSELELALSRSGSVSLQLDAASDSTTRNELELSLFAKLADQRDRVRNELNEPEDGEIHESVDSGSQPAMKQQQPLPQPDSEQQPVPDLKQATIGAADADHAPPSSDGNVKAVPFPPANQVIRVPGEPQSSDNDIADDDSKAPISRRIQRRRKSTPGTGRDVPAEFDHAPIRLRKRSRSLDNDKPVAPPRKQSARRLRDEAEHDLKRTRRLRDDDVETTRRRKNSADSESELSRRRAMPGKRKKDGQAADSSDSERAPSPPRTRRFSDFEPRTTRRQKPTPVSEQRKVTVWTEEEEQLLAMLRRQYGRDWDKIGSALQAQFPFLRPYTIVSVRCKWNYMCRHQHPLAFHSDGEEEAVASADEKVANGQQAKADAPEPMAVEALKPKANVRSFADSDDDKAVCDVDETGSISDVGNGVLDIADHDVLRMLLRGKVDWVDDTSIRDRRNTNSNKDRGESEAEDLAICDI